MKVEIIYTTSTTLIVFYKRDVELGRLQRLCSDTAKVYGITDDFSDNGFFSFIESLDSPRPYVIQIGAIRNDPIIHFGTLNDMVKVMKEAEVAGVH